jgi:hypothetical protein
MCNNVKVENVIGVPTFTINGKPMAIPAMETYRPEEYYFRQFAAAGCKIFSFNTNPGRCDYGHSEPIWIEKDKFDFTQFDARMENILRHTPDALVMPRVMFGTPQWWLDENPDEYMIMSDGSTQFDSKSDFLNTYPTGRPFPSIASKKWRKDMSFGLKTLIDHIQEKYPDNFFGIFISGMHTEEWYHWCCNTKARSDYSTHMENAFKDWLKTKYKTTENLRVSWNNNTIDIDMVKIPSQQERETKETGIFRDPSIQMNVIDFYNFHNEIIPDTINYFAKQAKEYINGEKVVGAFYAYMYEFFGDPEFGHNALGKYNESEYLDFVFVTASYEQRKRGVGADYLRAPAYSAQLHGKLWYHDNDVASFLTPKIMSPERGFSKEQTEHYCSALGVTENYFETIDMYRRSAGFALGNGLFESYFDLHGGYFDHPELMKEVSTLNRLFERSVKFDRSSSAQILIVADEESNNYATFKSAVVSHAMHNPQVNLNKIGAHCDHILSRDIDILTEDQLNRYKLVIFLNSYALSQTRRDAIEKKLKNNNRTLLFTYANGLFIDNKQSIDYMQTLTGFKFVKTDKFITNTHIKINSNHTMVSEFPDKTFGSADLGIEEIYVDDSNVTALGFNDNSNCVFALNENIDWKSIYCQATDFDPNILREIAKFAGVHIYNDFSDTFYSNKSYITIHASQTGVRTLKFEKPVNLFDGLYETGLATNVLKYSFDISFGQTKIFRYE